MWIAIHPDVKEDLVLGNDGRVFGDALVASMDGDTSEDVLIENRRFA